MHALPYLRKQSSLLEDFKERLVINDSKPRWKNQLIYRGMNEGLRQWTELVRIPYWYTLPDGWQSGVYEYALPTYIRPPVRAQVRRPLPYHEWGVEAQTYTYQDLPASVEADGAGGQVLRIAAPPRALQGRVGFRAPNSVVPYSTPLPTLNDAITASSTSLVLDSAVDCFPVGYIDIDGEKIAYFGVTRGSSSTTLSGLVRGLHDTTAESHSSGATVEWCVGVDDAALYDQLFDYVAYTLHRSKQVGGGTHERETHQQMMLFHKQNADNFWAGYNPPGDDIKLKLGRKKFTLR